MGPVQFFVFGLFFTWFVGTGKLRALLGALQLEPPPASAGTTAPRVESGIPGVPGVSGIGSLPSMPTGDPFDLNNPRNIWNGDPFGINQ